jgi:hypothetical protein
VNAWKRGGSGSPACPQPLRGRAADFNHLMVGAIDSSHKNNLQPLVVTLQVERCKSLFHRNLLLFDDTCDWIRSPRRINFLVQDINRSYPHMEIL